MITAVSRNLRPQSSAKSRLSREYAPSSLTKAQIQPSVFDLVYSGRFVPFHVMLNKRNQLVELSKTEEVMRQLLWLEREIASPVSKRFGLEYSCITEHHPNANRAALTTRDPVRSSSLVSSDKSRWLYAVRIRLRTLERPTDTLVPLGTQIALVLHELTHLGEWHHTSKFMILNRDIYRYAAKELRIFQTVSSSEDAKIVFPSPCKWERKIQDTRGDVSDAELYSLYDSRFPSGDECVRP